MAEDWYQKDPYPDEPSFSLHGRSPSESSSRRRSHFETQRGSAPSTSMRSQSRPKSSKGKGTAYDEPAGFANLDEVEAPPPIENPDDRQIYRRQSALEADLGEQQTSTRPAQPLRSSEKPFPSRRRRTTQHGEEELTEVAAPPPVQKDRDEEAAGGVGREEYLEDAEGEEETSDEQSSPLPKEDKAKKDEVPRLLTELYTISYLMFFAIIGTLARLGVQWITFFPGAPVSSPVIWANFGGSLFMGFLSEDQCLFRDGSRHDSAARKEKQRRGSKIATDLDEMAKGETSKRKKAIPLYIGLATGFCGSFTSFSSFARDSFLAAANELPAPVTYAHPGVTLTTPLPDTTRNGAYSFEAFLQIVIATLALSIGGLIAGAQIAIFLDPHTPRIHGSFVRKFVDPAFVVLGFGSWLGAVFLAIWPPDRFSPPDVWRGDVLFALVFAPLGCLLRFYVSMRLNGLVPAFPLGTFAVNMFGTAVEGMCFDLQHAGVGDMAKIGGGIVGCQVLQGILDGFAGCLTTVSTWVAEINGLKRKHGWWYAFGSILGGFCLLLVIMGGVKWSIGFQIPVCKTGYTSKING